MSVAVRVLPALPLARLTAARRPAPRAPAARTRALPPPAAAAAAALAGSAAAAAAPPSPPLSSAPPPQALADLADNPFGWSNGETAIVLAPALLYGLFSLNRAVDPKATPSSFLTLVALFVVLGNIFSILVFKTRLY